MLTKTSEIRKIQQNFLKDNLFFLALLAQENHESQGKGTLLVDLQSEKEVFDFAVCSCSFDFFLPTILQNAINSYEPNLFFLVTFKLENNYKVFEIPIPRKLIKETSTANFIVRLQRQFGFLNNLLLKSFLENNYLFLAALSYKANRFKQGVIFCDLDSSGKNQHDYLKTFIDSEEIFKSLSISFEPKLLNSIIIEEEVISNYDPETQIIVVFKSKSQIKSKIVQALNSAYSFPAECYQQLPCDLKKIIDNQLYLLT